MPLGRGFYSGMTLNSGVDLVQPGLILRIWMLSGGSDMIEVVDFCENFKRGT